MKKSGLVLSIIIVAGALAGCGKSEGEVAMQKDSSITDAVKKAATEARADMSCPANIKMPARAATDPVDDVLGVRPGMTYDEARNMVLCTNNALIATPQGTSYSVETYGKEIRGGFSATYANSSTNWTAETMGMPGEERVLFINRQENLKEGAEITEAALKESLIKKYGTPSIQGGSLAWAYDTRSRLITETSPLYNQCVKNATSDLTPDCGLKIAASWSNKYQNPSLVTNYSVMSVDKAKGDFLLNDTRRKMEALEMERRKKETENAQSKSGPAL